MLRLARILISVSGGGSFRRPARRRGRAQGQSQLVRRARPGASSRLPAELRGEDPAGGRSRVLPRDRRRGRAARGRGEAAVGVLRGARVATACACSSRSASTHARPACSSSPTRSAATSARRPGIRGRVRRARGAPLADAVTVNPYLGGDSRRAVSRRMPARRRGDLLPRQDVEPRQRRRAGRAARRRTAALAARRRARARAGARSSSASRGLSAVGAVVGATLPARGRRGPATAAAAGAPAPRHRRAGRAARPTSRRRSRRHPASALVSASRSVIYAHETADGDWREAAAAEAERFAGELRAVAAVG